MFKNYKDLQKWAFVSDAEIEIIDIDKIGCKNLCDVVLSVQIGGLQWLINVSYDRLTEFMNEKHPYTVQRDITDFNDISWYGYRTDAMLDVLRGNETDLLEWFVSDLEPDLR